MTKEQTYSRHRLYPHEAMEAAKIKMAPLKAKIVRRRADDIVEAQIETLLANRLRNIERPESEEKMGLVIYGDSGAGKTSLVRNRVANNPLLASMTAERDFGFVSVKFRAPVRIPTAGHAVIRKLGLPNAALNLRRDYWDEVGRRVAAFNTHVLHFDETQDAFRQNRSIAHTWLQNFKALMTQDTPAVLVLTGTTEMQPYFSSPDPQAPRRFVEITLPPLTFKDDAERIAKQIQNYCSMLGITNCLAGNDYERLMRASAFAFGRTLTLGLNGILEVILAGEDKLTLEHLAHAFERDKPSTPPTKNFFWAPDYVRLSPFGAGYGDGAPLKAQKSVSRKDTKW